MRVIENDNDSESHNESKQNVMKHDNQSDQICIRKITNGQS